MSWHFLQEQEGAYWAESSLDGAPSALLSLMPTAAGSCSPDSGMDSFRDSRSGTMCKPSTGSRGGGGVDVVSGGFPCTDISVAKQKAQGIEGEASGLWREMARIIGEVRPRFVFVENSPAIVVRGLGRVLGDLSEMGFDARWGVIGADACGFQHHRARFWLVANTNGNGRQGRNDSYSQGYWQAARGSTSPLRQDPLWRHLSESEMARQGYGLPDRLDRTRACGNAQVPAVAALAWRLLGGPDGDCGATTNQGDK